MRAQLKQWAPLVSKFAWSFRRRLAAVHDFEDLVAIGTISLWRAIGSYDQENESGASFKTYASRCLVHAFMREVKSAKTANRQVFYFSESLDAEYPDGKLKHEPATPDRDAEAELCAKQDTVALARAVGRLSAQQKEVIQTRYLCRRPQTFEEIGASYGVSRQRIEQIERSAMARMKAMLQHEQVSL